MKFEFIYFTYPNSDQLYPSMVNLTNDDESMLIGSYLTDDGGVSKSTRIEILEHFLGILENKEIEEADISGEHYMASIQNQQVDLEFVYDENQTAITGRVRLIRAIKAWISFIKKEPVKGYTEIIEI